MNSKILRKLFSCYPDLSDELSAARRELSDTEFKKLSLMRPKAVSWDGSHSQNPVSQAEILDGLITDEMNAKDKAAHVMGLMQSLRDKRDRLAEPVRTIVDLKYFQGHTWGSVESKMHMAKGTMDYMIERELSELA